MKGWAFGTLSPRLTGWVGRGGGEMEEEKVPLLVGWYQGKVSFFFFFGLVWFGLVASEIRVLRIQK